MARTPLSLFLFLSAATSQADIIGMHTGNADPVTEAWQLAHFVGEDLILGSHQGPIGVGSVTGDMGFDSWEIVDSGSADNGGYSIALTSQQEADAIANGFVLRTTAKYLENTSPSGARVLVFGTTQTATDERWVMSFGADENGDPTVSIQGGDTATLALAGPGYHTFELKVDPLVSSLATVSIDGVQVLTDQPSVPAEGNKPRFVYFGSWSNNAVGGARFSDIKFQVLSPFSADFDEDYDVDGADFLKWQRGETPELGSAEELALWESQFGSTVPAVAAAVSIPEPSTLLITSLAGVLFCSRRRRV